jgi:hypothetical protein
MNSDIFKLNWLEVGKALLTAVFGFVVAGIYTYVSAGTFPTVPQLGGIALAGLCAGIAYVIKTFLQGASGIPFKSN